MLFWYANQAKEKFQSDQIVSMYVNEKRVDSTLLKQFGMDMCNKNQTPAELKLEFSVNSCEITCIPYRQPISSLMCLAIGTWPFFLYYIVGKLSQFLEELSNDH